MHTRRTLVQVLSHLTPLSPHRPLDRPTGTDTGINAVLPWEMDGNDCGASPVWRPHNRDPSRKRPEGVACAAVLFKLALNCIRSTLARDRSCDRGSWFLGGVAVAPMWLPVQSCALSIP